MLTNCTNTGIVLLLFAVVLQGIRLRFPSPTLNLNLEFWNRKWILKTIHYEMHSLLFLPGKKIYRINVYLSTPAAKTIPSHQGNWGNEIGSRQIFDPRFYGMREWILDEQWHLRYLFLFMSGPVRGYLCVDLMLFKWTMMWTESNQSIRLCIHRGRCHFLVL